MIRGASLWAVTLRVSTIALAVLFRRQLQARQRPHHGRRKDRSERGASMVIGTGGAS
jgi:hypothetical protein